MHNRTYRCENHNMDGKEFVKRARRYAKKSGMVFHYDSRRGKGSHGLLFVGERRTVVARGELTKAAFHRMLKQLKIEREDF